MKSIVEVIEVKIVIHDNREKWQLFILWSAKVYTLYFGVLKEIL